MKKSNEFTSEVLTKMKEKHGWGDGTAIYMDDFEQSDFFEDPTSVDEYVEQFNLYVFDMLELEKEIESDETDAATRYVEDGILDNPINDEDIYDEDEIEEVDESIFFFKDFKKKR